MATVTWSPEALDDLDLIRDYIARDSPHHANLFVSGAFEAVEPLVAYPLSGRRIPELKSETSREIFYGSYRIMYEVEGDQVIIAGVAHGAMDWRPGSR